MDERTRLLVFERGDGVCEWCRERPMADIHHLKAAGLGGKKKRKTPLEELVGLCLFCHREHHG